MALSKDKLAEMDKASGLSATKIAEMDKIAGSVSGEENPKRGFLEAAIMHPIDTATRYAGFLGEAGLQGIRAALPGSKFGFTGGDLSSARKAEVSRKQILMDKSKELTDKARLTSSPEEKRRLLEEAKSLAWKADDLMENTRQLADSPETYFVDKDKVANQKEILREGTKATAGAASYTIPFGATIGSAIATGALSGGLAGFADSDRGQEVVSTVAGSILGGVMGGTIKKAEFLAKDKLPGAVNYVRKLFNKKTEVDPQLAGEAATKIIRQAEKASGIKRPGVAENVYISSLPFSRYGNSYQRLKPDKAAQTMIEDGIWGGPNAITTKIDKVTGKNGVLSNIVEEALNKAGTLNNVDDAFLVPSVVEGKYTHLASSDVNALNMRLVKAAPGKEVYSKNASDLFDFQQTLESEAWNILSKDNAAGKEAEFAMLKLDMAQNIEEMIDAAISRAGTAKELTENPYIVKYLGENVSENLAKKVLQSGGDLRAIREMQKNYVRMGKIIELANRETSALGKSYFSWLSKIEVIGPIIQGIAKPVGVGASTGTANVLSRSGSLVRSAGNASRAALGSLPITPSQAIPPAVGAMQTMLPKDPNEAFSPEGVPLYK